MSIKDLLKMSLGSLWRRKLRTILTMLGVVVGTASIVVMISLGLGLQKTSMEQIELSFTMVTISLASAGSTFFIACGRTTRRMLLPAFRPRERAASVCPISTASMPPRKISAT